MGAINSFIKVSGHRTNVEEVIAFLYTNNKHHGKNNRHTPFHKQYQGKKKYLGIMLTKDVKDICDGNFKSLNEETQEEWKERQCK